MNKSKDSMNKSIEDSARESTVCVCVRERERGSINALLVAMVMSQTVNSNESVISSKQTDLYMFLNSQSSIYSTCSILHQTSGLIGRRIVLTGSLPSAMTSEYFFEKFNRFEPNSIQSTSVRPYEMVQLLHNYRNWLHFFGRVGSS